MPDTDRLALPSLLGWVRVDSAAFAWGQNQIVWFEGAPSILVSRRTGSMEVLWMTPKSEGGFDERQIASGADWARAEVRGPVVHLAFVDVATTELRYAVGPGDWQSEVVDVGIEGTDGRLMDIAVDGAGVPSILYKRTGDQTLRLARRVAGVWEVGVEPGPPRTHLSVSLAAGSDGRLHLLSVHEEFGAVLYMPHENGEFGVGTLSLNDSLDAAIALDSSDKPDLVHGRREDSCIWYDGSVNIGAPNPPTSGGDCSSPSLQLDVEDRPHIAYVAGGPVAGLHYARRNWSEDTWEEFLPVPGEEFELGGSSSMVLDPDGLPHFSFVMTPLGGSEPILGYGTYGQRP